MKPSLFACLAAAFSFDYWKQLKHTAARRIALAGYRIAHLINSAADYIEAQRRFVGP